MARACHPHHLPVLPIEATGGSTVSEPGRRGGRPRSGKGGARTGVPEAGEEGRARPARCAALAVAAGHATPRTRAPRPAFFFLSFVGQVVALTASG
jgi:hypothetical protein